jgi:hypothetical protein
MSRGIEAGSMRVAGSIGTPSAFASKSSAVGLTGFCASATSGQAAKNASPAKLKLLFVLIARFPPLACELAMLSAAIVGRLCPG